MANPRHAVGREAERAVAAWLTGHGWQILAVRHRSPEGEVDLVALDPANVLVGVEVRARRTDRVGDPATSVRPRHLRRVVAALSGYARAHQPAHDGLRVDLVAVTPGPDAGTWHVRRLPGIDAW